jgi:hypothetical protein
MDRVSLILIVIPPRVAAVQSRESPLSVILSEVSSANVVALAERVLRA